MKNPANGSVITLRYGGQNDEVGQQINKFSRWALQGLILRSETEQATHVDEADENQPSAKKDPHQKTP